MNLCLQIQMLKKGSMTVDEYILQMRTIANGLQAIGQSITDDDLVLHILGGLGTEYEALIVSLTARGDIPTLSALQSILHTHEMRLLQASSSGMISTSTPTANVATKDSKSGNNDKSKGKPRFNSKPKVVCQLCGKNNHIAAKCFKRFDVNFAGLEQEFSGFWISITSVFTWKSAGSSKHGATTTPIFSFIHRSMW